ncbi:MAG: sporulation factor SpoIIGA, partial [Dorea sp.]|nr:sporulation factor SpoIIGA [Dorea sp.]
VCRKEKEWIERPLAAICEEDMTADRYEMILNPDVLIGGVDYGNQSGSTTPI